MKSTLAIVICSGLFVSGAATRAGAADGVRIVETMTGGQTATSVEIQADATHLRTETTAGGMKRAVIFDSVKQVMYVLDYTHKTYAEQTAADASQAAQRRADMQSQLASLPPAQRAQMEAMMRGRGMMPTARPEYKRNGTGKVGRWSCDTYDGYQGGTKISEVCTVPPATLGFTPADLDITHTFAAFYAKINPTASELMGGVARLDDQGFSGFPIRRTVTIMGRQSTVEVTEAGRATIPDSAFTVPEGFTKQTPMTGTR